MLRVLYKLAHDFGAQLHEELASRPVAAAAYFHALSSLRLLPSWNFKQRILNSIASTHWPELDLPFQTVVVGAGTEMRLRPHPGEFDMRSLLDRDLDYERPVFEWLEASVAHYDTIIEIGANVGVYSVFFGKRQRQTSEGPRPRIFAFEPGATAYRRLTENLGENEVTVHAMQRAVAEHAGVVELHEPAGHLTNASLRPDFAKLFSGEVAVHTVQAVDGRWISQMVGNPGRTLLKIDVEGAEAEVLRGLREFIEAHRPDVLIEVLSIFVPELQTIDFLDPLGYRYHAFRAGALVECRGFDSEMGSRDMILRCSLTTS